MRKFLVTNFTFVCLLSFINSSHTCSFLGMQKLRLKSSLLSQTIITWGGRGCWKLGMQITYQTLISGCKKSTIYFPDVQKVWAHMCTLCIRLALPYHVISNSYFAWTQNLIFFRFSNSLGSTKTPTNLWASHKHSFGEWPNVQFQGNCTILTNHKD